MPKVESDHVRRRRRQILDAALALFSAEGFHATSMQQIVRASGMSAGAVYHYFPTKRGLIEACAQIVMETFLEPLRTLPSRKEPPDPQEVIEIMCAHLAALHEETPDLTRLAVFLWSEELRMPELVERGALAQASLRAGLTPLAETWRRDGRVRPECRPEAVASALFGLLPGFVLQLNTLGVVPAHAYAVAATALGGVGGPAPRPHALNRSAEVAPPSHRWKPVGSSPPATENPVGSDADMAR